MTSTWLKLDEIHERTGIPIPTLNRYIKDYYQFLGGKKVGKPWKFPPEAVQVFERIKAYYDNGNSKEEIQDILSKNTSITIDVENQSSDNHQVITTNQDEIKSMVIAQNQVLGIIATTLKELADNKNELADNKNEIKELKVMITNLTQIIEEKGRSKNWFQKLKEKISK